MLNPPLRAAALAAALLATPAAAQRAFDWSGEVSPGATVAIFNFNGEVATRPGSGRTVRIHAVTENAGDGEVRFVSSPEGGGIRVCALRADDRCDANGVHGNGGGRGWWRGGSRARARFTVEVPRGVRVKLSTGAGALTVDGATDDVSATSGSGDVRVGAGAASVRATSGSGDVTVERARGPVRVSTGSGRVDVVADGPVNASTGSGRISVRVASARGGGAMELSTGSGAIDLALPDGLGANVEASTGNGSIRADLPIRVTRSDRHRLSGTLGGGGARVSLSTGSGAISLRRADP